MMRGLAIAVVTAAALTGCGSPAPAPATPTAQATPAATPSVSPSPTSPGSAAPEASIAGRFDIGGRSLYLECSGSGAPTVVLDAGAGMDTSTWAAVLPQLSRVSQVCAYDRANVGRSDPAPTPRTLADTVADLHELISRAGLAGPLVLVGHSFGGLDARLYAATYPAEVAGMILLDATPAAFVDAKVGCSRLSAAACQALNDLDLGSNSESLAPSAADMAAIEGFVPGVPSRIIAATDHGDPTAGHELERLAAALQQELAASWPRAGLVVAQGGHYVQDEHPELVIQAVEDVVRTARLVSGP